jgi:mRNA interferase MazF
MHDHLRTVLAAPMTTGNRPAPYRVPVRFQEQAGLILLDQIRALDKQRLIKRLGAVDSLTLGATLNRLQAVFAE